MRVHRIVGLLTLLLAMCATASVIAPAALGGPDARASARNSTLRDSVDDLQQEVESLTEHIEDLREPVLEFELFDDCLYTLGVTEFGSRGDVGYLYGPGGRQRRPALAYDMRGSGVPQFDFLSFPGEEPPSIECNEDAGEEFVDN
jgi:hypothetical protein